MSSSGPASSAVGNVSMPSASAARATASASMRSDLPRSRLARRELAISRVGTRTTRAMTADSNSFAERDRVDVAVQDLVAAGLVNRAGSYVFASHAAATLDRLWAG
jgi:hypothetical protein